MCAFSAPARQRLLSLRLFQKFLNLRYDGTDYGLMVQEPDDGDFKGRFIDDYQREHGFTIPNRRVIIDQTRVRLIAVASTGSGSKLKQGGQHTPTEPVAISQTYFEDVGFTDVDIYNLPLSPGMIISRPSIVIDSTAGVTIVIEPSCTATVTEDLDLEIHVENRANASADKGMAGACWMVVFCVAICFLTEPCYRLLPSKQKARISLTR